MSSLVIAKGSSKGKAFELPSDGETVIGRVTSCDFSIFDRRMSRRHCVVTPGPDGFTIKDLGSSNGVTINGKKLPYAVLHDGDHILLGETELDFFVADALPDAETEMLPGDTVAAAVDSIDAEEHKPDTRTEAKEETAAEDEPTRPPQSAQMSDVLDPVPAPARSTTALIDAGEDDSEEILEIAEEITEPEDEERKSE